MVGQMPPHHPPSQWTWSEDKQSRETVDRHPPVVSEPRDRQHADTLCMLSRNLRYTGTPSVDRRAYVMARW